MARARNIKPGFFKNEDLAECSPWARLCFVGLWALADREGRLEDRPKRIKAELFSFDTVDVEPLLQELSRHRFIVRYEVDGLHAIQILKFADHQTPHYTEKESVIKPRPLQENEAHISTELSRKQDRIMAGVLQDDSEKREGIKTGPLPPDSLNPDSLNHDDDERPPLQDRPPLSLVAAPPAPPPCPYQRIVDAFHTAFPASPRVSKVTVKRRAHLGARWKEEPKRQRIDWWERLFAFAAESAFLTGNRPGRNGGPPFELTLDFFIRSEDSLIEIIEGKYHREAQA